MFIVIDMGGTNTRIGVSDDLNSLKKNIRFNTYNNPVTQRKNIISRIKSLVGNEQIQAICLGVPGTLDRVGKKFIELPHCKRLNGIRFDEFLGENDFNCPVFVENDAAIASLGATVIDLTGQYKKVFYLTLGTGVGGAKVEFHGSDFTYTPLEPGHEIILGNGKTLEKNLSGPSFRSIYGLSPADCTDDHVWSKYALALGEGVRKIYIKYPFDALVIGGSISNKFSSFEKHLNVYLKNELDLGKFVIIKNSLGDEVGLYGGLVYLRNSAISLRL